MHLKYRRSHIHPKSQSHSHLHMQSATNQAYDPFVRIINKITLLEFSNKISKWKAPGDRTESFWWQFDEKLSYELRSITFNILHKFAPQLFKKPIQSKTLLRPDTGTYFERYKQSNSKYQSVVRISKVNCIYVVVWWIAFEMRYNDYGCFDYMKADGVKFILNKSNEDSIELCLWTEKFNRIFWD